MWWYRIRKLWICVNQRHAIRDLPNNLPLRCERGQSLVEFALTLPVLLLLVLGTIDLGLGYKTYIVLTNAAREGARSITIYPANQALAIERIHAEAETIGLAGSLSVGSGTISFSPSPPYRARDKVTVTVAYDYPLLFGAIPGLTEIPFTASTQMVVLYDK